MPSAQHGPRSRCRRRDGLARGRAPGLAPLPRRRPHGPVAASACFGTGSGRTYSAVGDTVNLGSRIEGLAPAGGVAISAETASRLHGAETKPFDVVQVKGRDEPVEVLLLLSLRRTSDDLVSSRHVGARTHRVRNGRVGARTRRVRNGHVRDVTYIRAASRSSLPPGVPG